MTCEDPGKQIGEGPNTGYQYLEAYLRSIGAVDDNLNTQEFWGKELCEMCKPHCGRDLLETFLCKHFCCVYNAERLLGEEDIEAGVDMTGGGKDIVLSLRFAGGPDDGDLTKGVATNGPFNTPTGLRVMFLIKYHAQLNIKQGRVELSY